MSSCYLSDGSRWYWQRWWKNEAANGGIMPLLIARETKWEAVFLFLFSFFFVLLMILHFLFFPFLLLVTCVRRRVDRPPPSSSMCCVYLGKYKKTTNFCLLSVEKIKWELPPNILITRNPTGLKDQGLVA